MLPCQTAFKTNSAMARFNGLGNTLFITYSGAIGHREFAHLDRLLLPTRRGYRTALERLERAILLPSDIHVDRAVWQPGTPPSVVVVRADQYSHANAFCHQLARVGVVRVAFEQSQLAVALALVERMAA